MRKTKLLAIYSIQMNMLNCIVINNRCEILLTSGKTLHISCPNEDMAKEVYKKLHWCSPANSKNSTSEVMGFEMEFSVWD
jgi:hypothetical protein